MTDPTQINDSELSAALGPTLLIDLAQDRILTATPEAGTLFADPDIIGSRFSRFVADGMDHR